MICPSGDEGKRYYRIGEVGQLTGVEPHVLRYWEGEFGQIRPRRVAGQRLYRREDVQLILRIKDLLHKEGFTIAGARRRLWEERRKCDPGSRPLKADGRAHALLHEIRADLQAIKEILDP